MEPEICEVCKCENCICPIKTDPMVLESMYTALAHLCLAFNAAVNHDNKSVLATSYALSQVASQIESMRGSVLNEARTPIATIRRG